MRLSIALIVAMFFAATPLVCGQGETTKPLNDKAKIAELQAKVSELKAYIAAMETFNAKDKQGLLAAYQSCIGMPPPKPIDKDSKETK